MAAGDSSTVAINIVVNDDGSIALIDATSAKLVKLQNVTVGVGNTSKAVASSFGLVGTNLNGMSSSITSTAQGLAGFSGAAIMAGDAAGKAGAGFGAMGGAVQGVRLGVQELGLHVPRAMESIIAHNATLAAGLRATMGIFIAMGAIEIFTQLAAGAAELYEKWFDTTKAVEAYQQKAGEAAELKLFDTASMEETVLLLREATAQVAELQQKRENGAVYPVSGFETVGGPSGQSPFTPSDDAAQAKATEASDKLAEHQRQLEQQTTQEQMKGQAAYDSAVTKGYAHASALEQDKIKEINADYDARVKQEANLVKIHNDGYNAMKAAGKDMTGQVLETDDPHAFDRQRGAAITAAQQEAAGQRVAMARTEHEETIRMQNEAVDAGVRGEALYARKQQEAIDEVTQKFKDGEITKQTMLERTQGIDMKFHNEKMVRLEQEQYETKRMQDEAAQIGLTGIAKTQAEGRIRSMRSQIPTKTSSVKITSRSNGWRWNKRRINSFSKSSKSFRTRCRRSASAAIACRSRAMRGLRKKLKPRWHALPKPTKRPMASWTPLALTRLR